MKKEIKNENELRGPIPIGMFSHAAGDATWRDAATATEFILKLLISGFSERKGKNFVLRLKKYLLNLEYITVGDVNKFL